MRSILLSIKPKYVELIASGEKTVEVRKTRPKLETPFKCYIYCTRGRTTETLLIGKDGQVAFGDYRNACTCDADGNVDYFVAEGNVIGEFVCDKIVEFENSWDDGAFYETAERACIGVEELARYIGKKDFGYGWHITDLKIYDKPRELSEFRKPCPYTNGACLERKCEYYDDYSGKCCCKGERPPQSYMYVEELGDSEND